MLGYGGKLFSVEQLDIILKKVELKDIIKLMDESFLNKNISLSHKKKLYSFFKDLTLLINKSKLKNNYGDLFLYYTNYLSQCRDDLDFCLQELKRLIEEIEEANLSGYKSQIVTLYLCFNQIDEAIGYFGNLSEIGKKESFFSVFQRLLDLRDFQKALAFLCDNKKVILEPENKETSRAIKSVDTSKLNQEDKNLLKEMSDFLDPAEL